MTVRLLKLNSSESGTGSLPDDLLDEQLFRMQLLYAAGVLLWTITCVFDVFLEPNGQRGPYGPLIDAAAALIAAVTIAYVRFGRSTQRHRLNVGAAMVIVHALAIATLNSWMPQPLTSRPISGISLLVLLFGMIAPASPPRMLIVTLIAATMDPIGVWLAHLRGLPVPPVGPTFAMFYLNYACSLISVVPARIVYQLGREVTAARALGSYELLEPLGTGGMGEVWIGRHRLLARNAAIKLIRADMVSGRDGDRAIDSLRRFELEAQSTAALTSPHTIRVFDFGLTREGTFYYVMELLDGRDLESLVREFGPLKPARVAHLLRQICGSLAEAHALGIIHRDIKPANIFTCRLGVDFDFVKVLDFGLVKHEHRPTAPTLMTSKLMTIGTPAYMAPEAILGESPIDRRVDIYALGCVAYYLLTGEQVFDAPSPMKLLMHHVATMPQPPSQRSPHRVPAAMDRFVLACLSKDPGQRPGSINQVLRLIDDCDSDDVWDQRSARQWWEAHLPQLSKAVPLNQTRGAASGYTAGAASAPAPWPPSIC